MMLLAAGLSGLPFAEDLMDLYDFLAKKTAKATGEEKLPTNIRVELRDFIDELDMNPDLVMHGAGRYSLGLSAVGDALGVPFPNLDMSGSLSMGRLIPGVEPLTATEGPFDARFAKGIQEVGGAVPSMGISLMQAVASDDPNTLKRFEKAMPTFAKSISKAYRYATEGKETVPGGAELVPFDMQDTMHVAEIMGQAMSFPVSRVQEERERYYLTKDVVRYYETRRRLLMQGLDYALQSQDRKAVKEAKDEIRRFNKSVPYSIFRVSGDQLINSMKQRARRRGEIESEVFAGKKGLQVQKAIK